MADAGCGRGFGAVTSAVFNLIDESRRVVTRSEWHADANLAKSRRDGEVGRKSDRWRLVVASEFRFRLGMSRVPAPPCFLFRRIRLGVDDSRANGGHPVGGMTTSDDP